MFQVNEVYRPTRPIEKIPRAVRIVDSFGLQHVVLIDVEISPPTVPFFLPYPEWVDLLNTHAIEKASDPFLLLTSSPRSLPKGAAERLKQVVAATTAVCQQPDLFRTRQSLPDAIRKVAEAMGMSGRTVKRWVLDWLQAGRNPAAVVRGFIDRAERPGERRAQLSGAKRGAKSTKPDIASAAAAHEVREVCEKAFRSYVEARRMTWGDAYNELLISLCGIPTAELEKSKKGLLMDPILIQKYRPPTWPQCRYVFRLLKSKVAQASGELPRGSRGKAYDNVPGPGYYEIDATFFQIQLVSEATGAKLVGRPVVYLIVDTYDGVIVGYTVSLENPSWAVAALALYNCFSDKGLVFQRLGLQFTSEDWPCHHLPTVLRADRAELVSNMGQDFPNSGIRVEITPSEVAIAKGTVEGKHSEMKKERPGRFDLPGRFAKARARRQSDGKKDAALSVQTFERILVEIIMDINGEPIDPRRIPPDALPLGAEVGSRIGFHRWALRHRAGFTRQMRPNFVYEHLLTSGRGTVSPRGIKFNNELFNCDRLRENGYLLAAVSAEFQIPIAHHPLYAGEVFFHDEELRQWLPAANIDLEIDRFKMSFAEAREYRAAQAIVTRQAGLNNHHVRRERLSGIKEHIKDAIKQKEQLGVRTSASKANIRENRKVEQGRHRAAALNGLLIEATDTGPVTNAKNPIPPSVDEALTATSSLTNMPPPKKPSATDAITLWDEIDAGQKG